LWKIENCWSWPGYSAGRADGNRRANR
jgi:hypothetical protein